MNKTVCENNPKLNAIGQTFYNSTINIPLAAICAYLAGDIEMAMDFEYTPFMLLNVFLASCAGICLSISRVLCNIFNSPMSTTITMCLKDVAGTMLGIVLFHDVDLTPSFIIGLFLSLQGSCYYSYIKYME